MVLENNDEVSGKIRALAAEKRVTQVDLAAVLGLSPMAMSRRMHGTTPFAVAELIKVAHRLGTSVSELLGEHPADVPALAEERAS